MTDQGWMVDDGTCTPCGHGQHHRCAEPIVAAIEDDGDWLLCCCNEGYDLGFKPADLEGQP